MINLVSFDGNGHKVVRSIRDSEALIAACNTEKNIRNWNDYRRTGEDRYKHALVQVNYNAEVPDGGLLMGVKTVSPFFFYDIDCGDREECRRIMKQLVEQKDELGLVEVSESASYGVHAVGRREPGRTILECQVRMSLLTKTEMDTNNKENNRVVFHGPIDAETTPLLDEVLFTESLGLEEAAAEYKRLKEREKQSLEEVPPGAKKANKHYKPWEESEMSDGRGKMEDVASQPSDVSPQTSFPKEYHGFAFTDILKKYWEVNNRGFEPTEGDRDTLTYQLACDLRHICGKSFEWLDQVIPCYDGFPLEEKRAKIRSALSSKYEGFPTRLRDTLNALQAPLSSSPQGGSPEATECTAEPTLLCTFPKLIKLLTSKTPEVYKAAVANAVFPPLATHLCGVRFLYTDGVEHEATLMNCLMAGTGAGKGCIDEPIRHIMADIKRRDTENLRREAEWKKDCQKKGANKDKLVRPEGLVIQEIDPDMTKPALVTRMDEAEGHFVYVKLNELDLFEQLKGQTGKQHFQLMCLAFDPGAEYGQTRIGTQSVTARPVCRFNWNACTTILKGRRFFQRVLTDGPISRINFCTIPEQEIGAEQPVYGQYDAAFDEALKPYIDNLTAARGLISCPQATRLAKRLQAECAEFARLSQSEVYWNLSHRACVIAWLKACVLYVANGQKWEKAIEDFVRWSLEYDLWCKMQFFGADIERANNGDQSRIGTRGPRNLLELLPDEFTLDDAKRVRMQEGMGTEKTIKMIRNWMNRGYVTQNSEFSFKKNRKN